MGLSTNSSSRLHNKPAREVFTSLVTICHKFVESCKTDAVAISETPIAERWLKQPNNLRLNQTIGLTLCVFLRVLEYAKYAINYIFFISGDDFGTRVSEARPPLKTSFP